MGHKIPALSEKHINRRNLAEARTAAILEMEY
jgi:hypothetical protein